MSPEPFIDPESRPDLTVDLETRGGDPSVRPVSDVLGGGAGAKAKEAAIEKTLIQDKALAKEFIKDYKDHKEQKDHKDSKDQGDHKAQKDHKDQGDHKAQKDHKDQGDHKGLKDHKDLKDHLKELTKEPLLEGGVKRWKDQKDASEGPGKQPLEGPGKGPVEGPGDQPGGGEGIQDLVRRVSGLEREVADLRGAGRGAGRGGEGSGGTPTE